MFLIVCVALIAARSATATPPHACCAPSPYSGVLIHIGASHKSGSNDVTFNDQTMELQYDYDNKIIQINAHTLDQNLGIKVDTQVWDDYKYSTRYILAPNGICYKQTIDPNSMQAPCVAGNLTYVGETIFGVGSHGVRVWMWSGSDQQGRLSVSVTSDGECIPVSMTRYGDDGSERTVNAYLFTNIQDTVDQNAFKIPRQCANATTLPSTKRSLYTLTGVHHPF